MNITFVGIKRSFGPIPYELGIPLSDFVKYHLELPWYFSEEGGNNVSVTCVDMAVTDHWITDRDTLVSVIHEDDLAKSSPHVVVHWRSWQQWAYDKTPDALHLLQTCDYAYSDEWKKNVRGALTAGQLSRVICFDTWHVRNTMIELGVGWDSVLTNVHLGVDTEIYSPKEKDPYQLLWASDPGRGLTECFKVFHHLYKWDRRYRLHITYPDYVKTPVSVSHPAIIVHKNLRNGPELWDLFNTSAFIPYTCQFMEPSSRIHRQGQAAGCCVLYPPKMGSPSELIVSGRTGLIMQNSDGNQTSVEGWAKVIDDFRASGEYKMIGQEARIFALTEDWSVQAQRFNLVCKELLKK